MREYDIAVAGAGLGGLAAAALLSSKGKRTIVCTPAPSIAGAMGEFARDGFLFSPGVSLAYGFEPGGRLRQLFADIGLEDPALERAPAYQVALPDRRITVSADLAETLEELRREFPGDIRNLERFYRDLKSKAEKNAKSRVSAFFSQRSSAAGFIRKYAFSKELLAFLDVQALFFFQQPALELSLAALITLGSGHPASLRGAYRKLADRLAGAVREKGGELRFSEKALEVAFRHGRAAGIKTEQGVVDARTILLDTFEKGLPCLYLGIRDEVVPVSMAQDVLYLPDYARTADFLSFSLSARNDPAAAPKAMRSLAVTFHASRTRVSDKNALLGRSSGLIPFLKDFLVLTEESCPLKIPAPPDLSFKPVSPGKNDPILYRSTRGRVHTLYELPHAPLQTISAAQKFVSQIT